MLVLRGQLQGVVISISGAEPKDVIGIGPTLLVPALDDDLVLGGGAETVKDKVAGVAEGGFVSHAGLVVGNGGDDVGPLGTLISIEAPVAIVSIVSIVSLLLLQIVMAIGEAGLKNR